MTPEGDQVFERGHVVQFGGMDQAHEGVADMGPIQGAIEERILAVQDGLFQDSFPKVMPTPGLCRVPGANKPISGESRFLVIELSALSKALEEGKQGVGGLISSGHKAARMGMRERAFLEHAYRHASRSGLSPTIRDQAKARSRSDPLPAATSSWPPRAARYVASRISLSGKDRPWMRFLRDVTQVAEGHRH
jgi:hypothetical protein